MYKPSDPMIRNNLEYSNYKGVVDPSANNIGLANIAPTPDKIGQPIIDYSTNPLTSNFWEGFIKEGGFISDSANKVGGMNSMSVSHDSWGQNSLINTTPVVQTTIIPAIGMQYCATFPSACGFIVSELINNNDFGTKK